MEKFTPGPWKTNFADNDPVIVGIDNLIICDLRKFDNYMTLANARLIAAAPEMYEFVKFVAEHTTGLNEAQKLINKINGAI